MFDLLREPVLRVRLATGGPCSVSLPEAYALLMADAVEAFTGLRPYQAPAWHAFLVQLGAIALHRDGRGEPPEEAGEWMTLLGDLVAPHSDNAFALVVEDWTKPAFLQPPSPDATAFKATADTPDGLDMLVTSKGHDLKAERMARAEPDQWAYALVSLQTFEGVMGSGRYGVSRMNGGYGSRPMLGIVPEGRVGAAVRRDIVRLLAARGKILDDFPDLGSRREVALTWLESWDGTAQLAPADLDPLFIEVCRRVRLTHRDGRIRALGAGSKASRIGWPGELKGRTGDPWAPVERKEGKVFSVTPEGFGYRRMARLLDRTDYDRPALARIDARDARQGLALRAAALARGQGKTEGFHQRVIPIDDRVRPLLARDPGAFDRFGEEAHRRAEKAGEFGRRGLRPALFLLVQGGGAFDFGKPTTGPQVEPWMKRYDSAVDATFFDLLFRFMAAEDDASRAEAEADWERSLRAAAEETLRAAEAATPRKATTVYRARAAARSFLTSRIRDLLPLARSPQSTSPEQPHAPL